MCILMGGGRNNTALRNYFDNCELGIDIGERNQPTDTNPVNGTFTMGKQPAEGVQGGIISSLHIDDPTSVWGKAYGPTGSVRPFNWTYLWDGPAFDCVSDNRFCGCKQMTDEVAMMKDYTARTGRTGLSTKAAMALLKQTITNNTEGCSSGWWTEHSTPHFSQEAPAAKLDDDDAAITFSQPQILGSSVNGRQHFWFPNAAEAVGGRDVVQVSLRDDSCCFKPPLPAAAVFLAVEGKGWEKQWDVPTSGPDFCGRAGTASIDGSVLCRDSIPTSSSLNGTSAAFRTTRFTLKNGKLHASNGSEIQTFNMPANSELQMVPTSPTINMEAITVGKQETLLLRVETLCPSHCNSSAPLPCCTGASAGRNELYGSVDGGKTWLPRSTIPRPSGCMYPRFGETQLSVKPGTAGRHLTYFSRCHPTPASAFHEGSNFERTDSTDGGITWSTPEHTAGVFAVDPSL